MGSARRSAFDVRAVLAEIKQSSVVTIDIAPSKSAYSTAIPVEVLLTLKLATLEALRNVDRHSGVSTAALSVVPHGVNGISFTVRDEGKGFDSQQQFGFGTRASIIGRMDEIAGHAAITSAPGHGTTVHLTWQPPVPDCPDGPRDATVLTTLYEEINASVPQLKRLYRAIAIAPTVGNFAIAAAYSKNFEHPPAGLILAAIVASLVGLTAWRISRGPLTIRFLVWVALSCSLCTAAGLYIAGPGSLGGFESWVVGFVALPIALVAAVSSPRHFTPILATQAAILGYFIVTDPSLGAFDAPAVFVIQPACAGFVWIIAERVRRTSRSIQSDTMLFRSANALASRRQAREAARSEHLARIEQNVIPFLQKIAEGTTDPTANGIGLESQVLAAQSRLDLVFPGLIDNDMSELLANVRRNGTVVIIRPGSGEADPTNLHPIALLRAVLDPSAPDKRLTLALPNGPDDEYEVAIIPGMTPERLRRLAPRLASLRATTDSDTTMTVIAVPASSQTMTTPQS